MEGINVSGNETAFYNRNIGKLLIVIGKLYGESLEIKKVIFNVSLERSVAKYYIVRTTKTKFLFWVHIETSIVKNKVNNEIYFDSLESMYQWLIIEYGKENGFLFESIDL